MANPPSDQGRRLGCIWSARGILTPSHQPRDQIATASSSNATTTRSFTGSSTDPA
jgi:hypothetical protein